MKAHHLIVNIYEVIGIFFHRKLDFWKHRKQEELSFKKLRVKKMTSHQQHDLSLHPWRLISWKVQTRSQKMTFTMKILLYNIKDKLLPCFTKLLNWINFLPIDFFVKWYMGEIKFHHWSEAAFCNELLFNNTLFTTWISGHNIVWDCSACCCVYYHLMYNAVGIRIS